MIEPVKEVELSHQIFIIDAFLKKRLKGDYEKLINKLIDELLDKLRMEKLGELGIFSAVDPRAPGWSFIQSITTSHISGHYFDSDKPSIHVDIYSCKEMHCEKIINVLDKHFNLAHWSGNFIVRSASTGSRIVLHLAGETNNIIIKRALKSNIK